MEHVYPPLPSPIELVDLEHGASMKLRIDKYERGTIAIHPKTVSVRHLRLHMDQRGLTEPPVAGTPITVDIPALRVYGERLDESSPAKYWDITSLTLQADLLARLYASQGVPLTVTLTANGYKPTKRYSVEIN